MNRIAGIYSQNSRNTERAKKEEPQEVLHQTPKKVKGKDKPVINISDTGKYIDRKI